MLHASCKLQAASCYVALVEHVTEVTTGLDWTGLEGTAGRVQSKGEQPAVLLPGEFG
eukprot:CAMPEP_0195029746 /NCGR_PEP_ID=MMETSP0326_2-20130528/57316_1 /TAXON_ID=2866 ORGANISM="Crypthecodinium cohnii, Strain Seligo" /NCGR_SAMPLE_ID=MMETSP0326_2 /ASSEMBLY_ACC=CAM_ASM_000348 /LENGTH=56 /DNA_ID=CAMNT_0040052765 /DNA_START=13 /DNA_END=183 /DNA_ORIENTATION=-